MAFKVKKKGGASNVLPLGWQVVTVSAVETVVPKPAPWKDKDEQVKVTLQDENSKQIDVYFNFNGFKKLSDKEFNGKCPVNHIVCNSTNNGVEGSEEYIVNKKTMKRVQSTDNEAKAIEIALRFVANAELAEIDTEFETASEVRDFIIANAMDAVVGANVVIKEGNKYRDALIYDQEYAQSKIEELEGAEA